MISGGELEQLLGLVFAFAGIVGAFTKWILSRLESQLQEIKAHLQVQDEAKAALAERVAQIEGHLDLPRRLQTARAQTRAHPRIS
jgi:cell division protein FtsB